MTTPIRIIDGHNDLAWTARTEREYTVEGLDGGPHAGDWTRMQTDIPTLRAGGVAAQFWSAYVDSQIEGPAVVTATLEQIDFVQRMIARYPDTFRAAYTASQARGAMDAGLIASLIGVEGGHQIDGSLAVLRSYARLGARYLTLTWSHSNDWADSSTGAMVHGGLAPFGREVVAEMNRIGMLVDLSHVSAQTAHDALDVSTYPVIASHSGAAAINPHPRNLSDELLGRIADGGGVVMVTFVPSFVTRERHIWVKGGENGTPPAVTVAHVADHVEHVRRVAGIEAVGIGGDFDGSATMPEGLEDVSGYPALIDELRSRGWSERELELLGSENALRVLEASDPAYRAFLGTDA